MGNQTAIRPQAVLVDVDGTLVDVESIRHLVSGQKRDFDAFHSQSIDCPPRPGVLGRVRQLSDEGTAVVLLSGRLEKFRRLTDIWLAFHDVPADELWMRANGDFRPDFEVKADMFRAITERYSVVEAIDDRLELLQMWTDLGVPKVTNADELDA